MLTRQNGSGLAFAGFHRRLDPDFGPGEVFAGKVDATKAVK